MNRKIVEIAGIIFAIAFIVIFIVVWSTTQSIVRNEVEEINSLYATDVAFDISLFDNRVVTGESILSFAADTAASSNTAVKMRYYEYNATSDSYTLIGTTSAYDNYSSFVSSILMGEIDHTTEYRTFLHYNENGVIDGIAIQK